MIKKFLLIAIVALAISGCATLANTGVVSERTSPSNDSTVVSVSPSALYAPNGTLGTWLMLGVRWTSATPNSAVLVISYNSNMPGNGSAYIDLSGLSINIDGKVSSYLAGQPAHLSGSAYNTVSHTVYTSITNAVIIPYPVLQRMVAAKACKLSVHTSLGDVDIDFSKPRLPGGKPTAITSIKKFMAKVAAERH